MTCYQYLYARANDDEVHARIHLSEQGFIVADDFTKPGELVEAKHVIDQLVSVIENTASQERLKEGTLAVLTYCDKAAAIEVLATFKRGAWYDMQNPDQPLDGGWESMREALVSSLIHLTELSQRRGVEASHGA